MDASQDQNFMCRIMKIWCKTCVFCCKKYPIPICILFLLFLSYLFFPRAFTFIIYSFPLVGFSFVVHRVFLGIDREKIKRVDKDDRRKKFAKSRRSFKSIYGDRNQLIRRHVKDKSDGDVNTNLEDNDAIFSKSLKDLLIEKKPKDLQELIGEFIVGRGECSSSNDSQSLQPHVYDNDNVKDELEGENWDVSEDEDDEPQDKAVRWTEEDQKNVMDLGISEAERNKRLESLIERRRSRKNLGYQEEGSSQNKNNIQVSAIKIVKTNPFLEDKSRGKKSPGSAPSSLLTNPNPFDLPYDPQEEKPDLSGDNFHEEFTVGHQKEPIFSRHESFSLGAFSHPEMTHDKHEISSYKDLAAKQKKFMGDGNSTVENIGEYKNIQEHRPISDDTASGNHSKDEGESSEQQLVGILHKKDGSARKAEEFDVHLDASNTEETDYQRNVDSYDERKADIVFFYGGNKQVGHAASNSIVSDLQVEVSDEGSAPILDDLDIEKDRESLLNPANNSEGDVQVLNNGILPSNEGSSDQSVISTHEIDGTVSDQETKDKQCVPETENNPQSLNSDMVQRDHIHESFGASQSSVAHVPDGLTEVAVAQAPVTSSSPKSVLQREFSTDPASPYNFANEVQQSDNHIREADSSANGLHPTNGSGESTFSNRNLENLQDQNDRPL